MSDRTRTLVYKINAKGKEFDFTNEKLTLIPPSVKLRFLRYGYFFDKEDTIIANLPTVDVDNPETEEVELSEVTVLAPPKDAPATNNFSVTRTLLNEGYLYIFDADDSDLWYEYKIDEQGNYHKIEWENNNPKDTRKPSGEVRDYVLIEHGKSVWAMFSPIQWSVNFHKKMRKDSAKAKYMKRIECKGFEIGESDHDGIFPYNKVEVGLSKKDENLKNNFEQILINAKETEQEKGHKENYVNVDMFVTIDDAVGMASEVTYFLDDEIANHRANLEAMRFGKNPAFAKQLLKNGNKKSSISNKEKQQSAMFTLAHTSYQLVYNSDENEKKYDGGKDGNGVHYNGLKFVSNPSIPVIPDFKYDGNGLYKKKITAVLGVEERKEQRKFIRSLQKDLADMLKSTYFDDALIPFADDNELNNLIGKILIYNKLGLLAINPHDIDRSLDLKKDQEKINEHQDYLKERFEAKSGSNLDKTLTKDININDKTEELALEQDINLGNKAAGFADKFIETFSQLTTKKVLSETIEGTMHIMVTQLNRVKFYGVEAYEVKNSQFYGEVPENTKVIETAKDKAPYKGKKPISRFRVDSPHIVLKESLRGKHVFEAKIETTNQAIKDVPTLTATKAEAILNSKAFRRTVALLQVFNLGVATVRITEYFNTKNAINLAGITAEFSEAVLKLNKERLIIKYSSEKVLVGIKGVSIAGAAITTIMCVWDAYDSFEARDGDTAWAYVGAAAAFSGVTVATVFAGASWAGPLGWICAGIGLGFIYLAFKLTDTPLEKYFKFIAFSDAKPLEFNGDPAWKYNQRIYANRVNLTNNKYDKHIDLTDFFQASSELHDILVCSKITFNITKTTRDNSFDLPTVYDPGFRPVNQKVVDNYASSFEMAIFFNQFLSEKEQLNYDIYYFADGIRGNHTPLDKKHAKVSIKERVEHTPPQVVVQFDVLPAIVEKATSKSAIMLVCRLSIGKDRYYPATIRGNERYLGALMGLHQFKSESITNIDLTLKKDTRIDSKYELLNFNAWEK